MKEIFNELIEHLKFNRDMFVFDAALTDADGQTYYDSIVDEPMLWQCVQNFAEAIEGRIQ